MFRFIGMVRATPGRSLSDDYTCYLLELEDRGVDLHRSVALEDVANSSEGLFPHAHLTKTNIHTRAHTRITKPQHVVRRVLLEINPSQDATMVTSRHNEVKGRGYSSGQLSARHRGRFHPILP